MAGRVAGRRKDANARCHLGPFRQASSSSRSGKRWRCAGGGPATFGQQLDPARVGPQVILDTVDDQFGLGKHGSVRAPLHEAPDMVRVEMRDQDRADLAAIDAGRLHVGRQMGGVGLPLADPEPASIMMCSVPDLQNRGL